jgi:hypothetical protein
MSNNFKFANYNARANCQNEEPSRHISVPRMFWRASHFLAENVYANIAYIAGNKYE